MESEARYAVVGAFVFTIASAALVFIIWLGQINLDREYTEYQVVFKGPVRGLSQSGEVRFNGIKVGEVRDLRLDAHDPNKVLAQIQIFAETPIKEDSYAQLEPQGITGLAYIQIYGGTTHGQKLLPKPGDLYAQIPTKQAQLDGLVAGGADVLLSANTALVRVMDLLNTKNLDAVSQILVNLNTLSGQLSSDEELDGDIGKMLRSITQAANSIEIAATQMAQFAKAGTTLIEGDTADMVAEIAAAATELEATSTSAKQLVEQMSEPMARFSNEGLAELTLALADLRSVLQAVDRVVEEVDRDPGEFIAGEPVTEIEVPR